MTKYTDYVKFCTSKNFNVDIQKRFLDKLSNINFLTNIDEQYLKGVSEGIQISVKLLKDCCNEMEQEYIVKLPI